MSSDTDFKFSTSTSFKTSSTSNGQTTGLRFTEHTNADPHGTTTHTASQTLGEEPVAETKQFDAQGRELANGETVRPSIEDVTDADRQYEERMEDEYAKREGGA
ncbi:hypothetical protein CAC42_3269 [Sphaceloma murrayae]|uniref:Uncharacterized protein n=1 Tax=Sphaceloma murrayae TaxID=2082308 RepID=A0A2K1QFF0_9PEZI|nr:hypothetical protein CAC42_3269 [Sphaceloma murrayae]